MDPRPSQSLSLVFRQAFQAFHSFHLIFRDCQVMDLRRVKAYQVLCHHRFLLRLVLLPVSEATKYYHLLGQHILAIYLRWRRLNVRACKVECFRQWSHQIFRHLRLMEKM
jgi:hypothetical protein